MDLRVLPNITKTKHEEEDEDHKHKNVNTLLLMDLITLLSSHLESRYFHKPEDTSKTYDSTIMLFHGTPIRRDAVHKLFQRFQRTFKTSGESMILAVGLFDRLDRVEPKLPINAFTVYRFLLTSLIIATKFHDEHIHITSLNVARCISGKTITYWKVNELEFNFLTMIRWKIGYTPIEYYHLYRSLTVDNLMADQFYIDRHMFMNHLPHVQGQTTIDPCPPKLFFSPPVRISQVERRQQEHNHDNNNNNNNNQNFLLPPIKPSAPPMTPPSTPYMYPQLKRPTDFSADKRVQAVQGPARLSSQPVTMHFSTGIAQPENQYLCPPPITIQSFSLKRSTSNYDNSDANKKALSSFIRSQQLLDGQSGPSVAKTQLTMSRNSLPTLPTITHLDLKHNNNNVTKKLTHSSTLPVLLPPPQPKKNSIKGSSDFLCCFGQPQSTPKISST